MLVPGMAPRQSDGSTAVHGKKAVIWASDADPAQGGVTLDHRIRITVWDRHVLASGFRLRLARTVCLHEKSAFDLGGLGVSRVLSATSRRHFSGELRREAARGEWVCRGRSLMATACSRASA